MNALLSTRGEVGLSRAYFEVSMSRLKRIVEVIECVEDLCEDAACINFRKLCLHLKRPEEITSGGPGRSQGEQTNNWSRRGLHLEDNVHPPVSLNDIVDGNDVRMVDLLEDVHLPLNLLYRLGHMFESSSIDHFDGHKLACITANTSLNNREGSFAYP